MTEVHKAWQALIDAMLKMSDKSSDYDMMAFNMHGRTVNLAVNDFLNYHKYSKKS